MTEAEFTQAASDLRQRTLTVGYGYGMNADEVEDMAQDAMVKLWMVREQITDRQHAEGLLVSIAKHQSIDRLRRRHTVAIDCHMPVIDEKHPLPDTEIENAENEQWIERRLKELPPTEYEVLRLRQVERKSSEEIAMIVGIKLTSVATLLSRARKKMLKEIQKRNNR